MAGESRGGHEVERGHTSVNVSAAAFASYAIPIGGGNSITVSTSWDVSSFGGFLQSAGAGYTQRVEIWKERAGSFGTVTEKNGRPMPGHTGHNWDKEAVV